ncbi:hypothetical protein BC936DRAFT_143027 [Jimgerdemannia flammicorona]|uniref:Uncharacterized protein n=1 Tax=Jimgerdemannia flammicorona TaxID=994334 RepID=A0A432ZZX4_9FUNG|nr:hypothetical protein BC936DRAFT_143027 [Jimgerdemannia flammicorona]
MVISLPELKRAMSLASCETSIGTAFVKVYCDRLEFTRPLSANFNSPKFRTYKTSLLFISSVDVRQASITRLGQLKLTPTKGYMLVAYVTDGSGVEQCSTSNLAVVATSEIPVLLGNKIVTELMELNHTELIAIKKTEGDKSVGRYFGRLRDKVVGVEALLELDITSVTSVTPAILRKSFNGIRTKTALGETASRDSIETPVWAPLVVGYEKTSPLGCHTE